MQITQVLELNSHAPKTFAIVAGLDARPEPLTPPQKDRINQGKALVNDFERLRARQVFFLSERNYYIFSSIAYSKGDSTANALKEIEDLYAQYPFRSLAYELAETYMANNRVNDANAVLQNYVPTVDEQSEHTQLLSFYHVYSTLLSEERSTEELTAEELTTLQQLELLDGIVGAKARALLIAKTGVDDYIEPRYLPEDDLALRENNNSTNGLLIEEASTIGVYPNPTDGAVIFSYELKGQGVKENEQLLIKVSDLLGRELLTEKAECCNGSIELNLRNLSAGAYVVSTYNATGKLLAQKHLRIVK